MLMTLHQRTLRSFVVDSLPHRRLKSRSRESAGCDRTRGSSGARLSNYTQAKSIQNTHESFQRGLCMFNNSHELLSTHALFRTHQIHSKLLEFLLTLRFLYQRQLISNPKCILFFTFSTHVRSTFCLLLS